MDNEDAALSFLQPDETFADFLSRVDIKSLPCGIPIIDHRFPLRNGTILEISGCAGTGKTEILYHVRKDICLWLPVFYFKLLFLFCSISCLAYTYTYVRKRGKERQRVDKEY